MCSLAHAIFILPEGASLGSFTWLKVKLRRLGGEYQGYTLRPIGPLQTVKSRRSDTKGVGNHEKQDAFRNGVRMNRQPTLFLKSSCAALSWKNGRDNNRRIKFDSKRTSIRGTWQYPSSNRRKGDAEDKEEQGCSREPASTR